MKSDMPEEKNLPTEGQNNEKLESQSSIEPYLLVKVPRNANRDEIVGAVDRALSTRQIAFLSGPGSTPQTMPGKVDDVSASAPAALEAHTQVAAAPADTSGGASGSDDDQLLLLVQKEGF